MRLVFRSNKINRLIPVNSSRTWTLFLAASDNRATLTRVQKDGMYGNFYLSFFSHSLVARRTTERNRILAKRNELEKWKPRWLPMQPLAIRHAAKTPSNLASYIVVLTRVAFSDIKPLSANRLASNIAWEQAPPFAAGFTRAFVHVHARERRVRNPPRDLIFDFDAVSILKLSINNTLVITSILFIFLGRFYYNITIAPPMICITNNCTHSH